MVPAETRLTPARRAILAAVERRRDAFTVEEIQQAARTSPATTYRTI
jgi:Fe2+ or Zn2+ uptake regulation protein